MQSITQSMPNIPNFQSMNLFQKLKVKYNLQHQARDAGCTITSSSSSAASLNSSRSSLSLSPPPSIHEGKRSRAASFVSHAPSSGSDESITYINAITFDGGGIRGAASAKVMEILEDDLSKASGAEAQIADYFDMFGGTSTGGLIAMMLGRLRVPAKTLLTAYSDLSMRMFSSKVKLFRAIFQGCKYSGKLAERLFTQIVADNSNEGPDTVLRNAEFGAPDVFVAAINANDASGAPLVIRSYDSDSDSESSYPHRIADAARATTAAPAYFPAKTLGNGKVALDGGLTANNPTDLLISEARAKHGRGVRFGLLLSVGTGVKAPMAVPACSSAVSILSFTKAIGHILTDSERTHQRVEQRFQESDLGTYLRINIPGIGDVHLDDYKSIPAIVAETERYMNSPEMLQVRKEVVEVLLRTQNTL